MADKELWDIISILTYVVFALSLCLLPIHILDIRDFWTYRTSICLLRRHPNVVLTIDIGLMAFIYVFGTYHVLFSILGVFSAPDWVAWLLFSISCYAVCWLCFLRSWLYFFSTIHHKKLAEQTWADLVSSTHNESDFFLNHYHTWGDATWVGRIIGLLWGISVLVYTLISYYEAGQNKVFIWNVVLVGLPWLLIGAIWVKMRHFHASDFFKIRDELLQTTAFTFAFVVFYFLLHWGWTLAWSSRVDALLNYFIYTTWANGILFLSTRQVLRMNREYLPLNVTSTNIQRLVSTSQLNTARKNSVHNENANMETYIASSEQHFHMFMNHVMSEFSAENILFIMELAQYKAGIKANIKKSEWKVMCGEYGLEKPLKLPTGLPASELMSINKTPYKQSQALYAKYCDEHAFVQVNIRSNTRTALKKTFDANGEPTIGQLYGLFDSAEQEILSLLRGSWDRFKQSGGIAINEAEFALSTPATGALKLDSNLASHSEADYDELDAAHNNGFAGAPEAIALTIDADDDDECDDEPIDEPKIEVESPELNAAVLVDTGFTPFNPATKPNRGVSETIELGMTEQQTLKSIGILQSAISMEELIPPTDDDEDEPDTNPSVAGVTTVSDILKESRKESMSHRSNALLSVGDATDVTEDPQITPAPPVNPPPVNPPQSDLVEEYQAKAETLSVSNAVLVPLPKDFDDADIPDAIAEADENDDSSEENDRMPVVRFSDADEVTEKRADKEKTGPRHKAKNYTEDLDDPDLYAQLRASDGTNIPPTISDENDSE